VTSALATALIGADGSVVGGIVGGWLAIVAVRGQWKRDRASGREERSQRAAMAIADSVASLAPALVAWSARQMHIDHDVLREAVNAFSGTAAVQTMALTDDTLSQRLRAHVQLFTRVVVAAQQEAALGVALTELARRQTDAVLDALGAHCRGDALPPYQPIPLTDVASLLNCRHRLSPAI
jgi:hypothetical protein